MSKVIEFPKPNRVSQQELENIRGLVTRALDAHSVLSEYAELIKTDPRLNGISDKVLATVLSSMINKKSGSKDNQ
ncbi:MAG: hypothetical protein OEY38_18010 [Gammaproteobacteria bacterium]|nr:hypothetical protein [Gammaproteobacteria bacterium]